MAEDDCDGATSAAASVDSVSEAVKQAQIQAPFFVPVVLDPASGIPMIPLYPEQNTQLGGIFAVPMFGSSIYPPIPFAYNAPIGVPLGGEGDAATDRAAGAAAQAGGRQERVLRFRVGFQLDLLLILKLITMVFIFSQDGSRDRLLLLFVASVVYLYQTGALAPLLRWASERARRAMMPPPLQVVRPPPGVPQPEADAGQAVLHPEAAAAVAGAPPPAPIAPRENPEEIPGAAEAPAEEQFFVEAQQQQVGNWRGFLREMQMIIVGFVTSLLPGFHHNLD